MIRINLLPIERQRKERTPLPRFIAINVAVIICLLLGFWDIRQYRDYNLHKMEAENAKTTLAFLKAQAAPYEKMLAEEQELTAWIGEGNKIKSSRSFLWWQQIDQIWDVIDNASDVWITSLAALDTAPPSFRGKNRAAVAASLVMSCYAAGTTSDRMTAFRIAIKNHPGLKEVFNLGLNEPPQFTLVATPQYKEEYAVKFQIELAREVPPTKPK